MAFCTGHKVDQYFYDDDLRWYTVGLKKKGKESDHKAQFMLKLTDTWIIQFLYDNKKDGRKVF